ncbi:MAG: DUF364 domain-containing protein [Armatimonadota bacterium]|nr:DUF364 domain-containing protein [Armatimonadota bacterium]MDR7450835.1 DUF364 domain-containing protein [Armatimonadota bacterium]MDR7465756.1 DUF364 domain-containing protein [Armatimonadota bacterium]MDR7493664.1 DUF364 domain-containing protein [Armatimonadota bacterium]MDR7499087.1 DUF364 domain-containing protein [Armatimonadota bacterium]
MSVIDDLLASVRDGVVRDIVVGAFKTAVVVEVEGLRRCGLASTPRDDDHHYGGGAAVPEAGRLLERSARALADLARSRSPMEAAIGLAAINALLPAHESLWTDLNAEEVITAHGAGKRAVLVGHFPFVPELRKRAGTLWVLEERPREDDLPAGAAAEVIPQADVLALSGTTLINHTFDALMALRRPDALVVMLGPSTPLSPVLFRHGVHVISGAVVAEIDAVFRAVGQGANFRQLRRLGVRLVTMRRGDR